jgi:midasin
MLKGHWVLLDELNLASQQVLEGLNACLDHRATIYIPELDRHFICHPDFRVFAAQNPHHQGGGRKGLPKSFVNRFTQVYVDTLVTEDLEFICGALYPNINKEFIKKMITFNERVKRETMELRNFGMSGSPWEFNLRDVLRWIKLLKGTDDAPSNYINLLYIHRMRTQADRLQIRNIYEEIFDTLPVNLLNPPLHRVTEKELMVGSARYERKNLRKSAPTNLQLLPKNLTFIESMLTCVETNVMPLLVGPTFSGKTSLVRLVASLCGQKLVEFPLNPGIDSLELLGGFEQVDINRREQYIVESLDEAIQVLTWRLLSEGKERECTQIEKTWDYVKELGLTKSEAPMEDLLSRLEEYDAISADVSQVRSKLIDLIKLSNAGVHGQFEWMDSALIIALEKGHWLLLDNVNLCSSSVLDRLNSLLEVGGTLAVNERGLLDGEVKVIKPHANFRIFMTMDPIHGEISRAMRNRAVELYVEDFDVTSGALLLSSSKNLTSLGLPGIHLGKLVHELDHGYSYSLAKVLVELLRLGKGWQDALAELHLKLAIPDNELLPLAASYPDAIPGYLFETDPLTANILCDGSLLFHFATEVAPFLFTVVDDLPSQKRLICSSLAFMLRNSSELDISHRLSYIKFISTRSNPQVSALIDDLCESFKSVRHETIQYFWATKVHKFESPNTVKL